MDQDDGRIPTTRPFDLARPARQRALGVMLGAAVGDALGAPFEFGPAGRYLERFPEPVLGGIGEMIGGGFRWAPGEFTDDTQMAVAFALSLIRQGGYDPDDVWQHWRAWASTAADVGITTREALGFTDWRKVRHHDPERTAANGALMRAFPLAIAFAGTDTDTVRDVVLRQAALTHPHPAAGWGAWLGVAMMRAGIHGDHPFEMLDVEITRIPPDDREPFTTMLAADWQPTTTTPGNGSVWGCLAQAVWAVRNHDTFAAAVTAAIDLGGDTDTVACVNRRHRRLDPRNPGDPVALVDLHQRIPRHPYRSTRVRQHRPPGTRPRPARPRPTPRATTRTAGRTAGDRSPPARCEPARCCSRTGLVPKAWKMRTDGIDERTAHRWLGDQWPLLADHNDTFRQFLQHDWPA